MTEEENTEKLSQEQENSQSSNNPNLIKKISNSQNEEENNIEFEKELDPNLLIEKSNDIEEFYCPLCNGILNDPVIDKCSHTFCKICFEKYYNKFKSCPISKQKLDEENLTLVPLISKTIGKKEIKCKNINKGCNWIGKISDLKKHLYEDCKKFLIKCPFENCNLNIMRENLNDHKNKCEFRSVECEDCKKIFPFKYLSDHSKICLKKKINCPQNCGKIIERGEIDNHIKFNCDYTLIDCQFKKYGCLDKYTKKDFEKKMMEDCYKHLILVTQIIDQLENKFEKNLSEFQFLKKKKERDSINENNEENKEIIEIKDNDNNINKRNENNNIISNNNNYNINSEENNCNNDIINDKVDNNINDNQKNNNMNIDDSPQPVIEKKSENNIEKKKVDLNNYDKLNKDLLDNLNIIENGGLEQNNIIEINNNENNNNTLGKVDEIKNINNEENENKKEEIKCIKNEENNNEENKNISNENKGEININQEPKHLHKYFDEKNINKYIKITNNIAKYQPETISEHVFLFINEIYDINPKTQKNIIWSIKLITNSKWIAFGLCDKEKVKLNKGKFCLPSKIEHFNNGSYLISNNGYSWNCNNIKENNKKFDFPRFDKIKNEFILEFNAFENKLKFFSSGKSLCILNNVIPLVSPYKLTPCVVFLNKNDCIEFEMIKN